MKTIEGLLDIANVLGVLNCETPIKVTATSSCVVAENIRAPLSAGGTYAASQNADYRDVPEVLCYGRLKRPFTDLIGTVGLARLSVLQAFATFQADPVITIASGLRGVHRQPIEIQFDYSNGAQAWYRFMGEAMINKLVNVPKLKGAVFDVSCSPDATSIALLKSRTKDFNAKGVYRFWAHMYPRGILLLSFDSNKPSDQTDQFLFAKRIAYAELAPLTFSAEAVTEVLRLAASSVATTLSISNAGYLKIEVETALGYYTFVFLGGTELISEWHLESKWPQHSGVEQRIREDICMGHEWEPDLN